MVESCDRVIDMVDTLIDVSRIEQGEAERVLQVQDLDLREVAAASVEPLRRGGREEERRAGARPAGRRALACRATAACCSRSCASWSTTPSSTARREAGWWCAGGRTSARWPWRSRTSASASRPSTCRASSRSSTWWTAGSPGGSGGTGVGLYLVREIVRLHQGHGRGRQPARAGQPVLGAAARASAGPAAPGGLGLRRRAGGAACLRSPGARRGSGSQPQPAARRRPARASCAERLQRAWRAATRPRYLALWDVRDARRARRRRPPSPPSAFRGRGAGARGRPPPAGPARGAWPLNARVFTVTEPRGRARAVAATALERGPGGWAAGRRASRCGQIDGLRPPVARPRRPTAPTGLTLRLEDFELRDGHGHAVHLAARARAHRCSSSSATARCASSPAPAGGARAARASSAAAPELVGARPRRVRPHPSRRPAPRAVAGALRARPGAARAPGRGAARSTTSRSRARSCSTPACPRSPWWLLPGPGRRRGHLPRPRGRGTLTYALSADEPEGISLFDRERRRQICLYPRAGREHALQRGRRARASTSSITTCACASSRSAAGWIGRGHAAHPPAGAASRRCACAWTTACASTPSRSRAGGRPPVLPRARPGQPDGVAGRPGRAPSARSADRPLRGRAPAGRAVEHELLQVARRRPGRAWTARSHRARARLLEPDGLVPAGAAPTTTRGRGCGSTCPRAARRSRAARARRRASRGRPHLPRVPAGPAGQVHHGRGRAACRRSGALTAGGRALRGVRPARARAARPSALLAQAAEILRFFEAEFGPCPYASLQLVVIEGDTPGGHSPPGMVILSRRPAAAARRRCATTRRPSGTCPASSSPTSSRTSGGATAWPGRTTASAGSRRAFAQYAAALWVRHGRGEEAFRERAAAAGALGAARDGAGPDPPRPPPRPRARAIRRSTARSSTTRARTSCTCCAAIVGDEAFRAALIAFQESTASARWARTTCARRSRRRPAATCGPTSSEWVYGTELPRLAFSTRSEPGSGRLSHRGGGDGAGPARPGPGRGRGRVTARAGRTGR